VSTFAFSQNVNKKDKDGWTALMLAAMDNQKAEAEKLCTHHFPDPEPGTQQ
jgi:ankyrin repeat protein